ncbi:MAG: ABC transporter substrate-binding protein, partial [Candidatus Kariarchaeaceae archaeon]
MWLYNNCFIRFLCLAWILIFSLAYPISAHHEDDPTQVDGFEPFFSVFDIGMFPLGLRSDFIADAYSHIGIDIKTLHVPTWEVLDGLYYASNRANVNDNLNYSLSARYLPVPTYIDGGFDMISIMGFVQSPFSPIYCSLEVLWETECELLSFMYDFGYNNTKYFDLVTQFYSEFDKIKRQELFSDAMDILKEDVPYFNQFQSLSVMAIADEFGLTDVEAAALTLTQVESNIFSTGWADLSYTGSDTIVIADEFYDSVNLLPLFFDSIYHEYSRNAGFNFPSLVYQGLYQRDHRNGFTWQPLLASGLPMLSENKTIITVNLNDTVVFADGAPLTAYDVVESYRMIFTMGHRSSSYYANLLNGTEAIFAEDDYTVKFNLTFATPFYMNLLKLPVIPTHTWGNSSTVPPWWIIDSQLTNDLITNGTSSYGIGTGPFQYSWIKEEDIWLQNITLIKNPNYWMGDVQTENIILENYLGYEDRLV